MQESLRRERRSRSQGFSPERAERAWENTGVFSGVSAPKLVGVSDTVRISNRDLARRANREMRRWQRTLPKGVKV